MLMSAICAPLTVLMHRLLLPFSLAAGLLAAVSMAEVPCGNADAPCEIDGRTFYASTADGAGPLLVFLHGLGGSGADFIRANGLASRFNAAGISVLAPDAEEMIIGSRTARNWRVVDGREGFESDLAFLHAAVERLADMRGAPFTGVYLGGFSRGGSYTWDVACLAPSGLSGFLPVSGALWHPVHDRCTSPFRMLHTHGTSDRVVPLVGREIRAGLRQATLRSAVDLALTVNGCNVGEDWATWDLASPRQWSWSDCGTHRVFLDIHDGGHALPRAWAEVAIRQIEHWQLDSIPPHSSD